MSQKKKANGAHVVKRYRQPKLSKRCDVEKTYQALLRACARQISQNWKVVRDEPDIHGSHQMRVGLRRLRSTLTVFRPHLRGKRLSRLETEARDIAQIVGELRDLDVLATQIVPAVAAALPGDRGLARLQAKLGRLPGRTHADVVGSLNGDRIKTFRSRLNRARKDPRWRKGARKTRAGKVTTPALENSWQRVERWGGDIEKLSIPDRHAMRKALKRLRYQTEAFASFYPARKTGPFLKKLKNIQDLFGYLNDVAMAEKLSALPLADTDNGAEIDAAITVVLDWHTAKYEREWRKAKRSWKSLEKTEKFWRV